MSESLVGTCLCGSVEYEVQDPEALGYCHCTRCQRWTGSSLAGVVVAKENFRFTKGEDLVTRYESEFAPRNFCSHCGSSLYDDLGEDPAVIAGAGTDMDDMVATAQFELVIHTCPKAGLPVVEPPLLVDRDQHVMVEVARIGILRSPILSHCHRAEDAPWPGSEKSLPRHCRNRSLRG